MNPQDAWKSWQIAESTIDTHTSIELAQMFHFACLIGYAEKAVMLYRLIHDVDMPGRAGVPLCRAEDIAADLAKTGNLTTLQKLEEAGFDLIPHLDESLALAAEFGHQDMALYLVQRGADAGALLGRALVHAAQNDKADMLKNMMDYKSYPQIVMFDLAVQASKDNRYDILAVLFDHGFDIHQRDEGLLCKALSQSHTQLRMLDYLKEKGANPVPPDYKPLQTVIANTVLRNTDWVLEEGADPLLLPKASYDAGMKNKLLGDKLREAIDRHTRIAEQQAATINWKQSVSAPDFKDLFITAVRGGQLRRMIDLMLEQETDMAAEFINTQKLETPVGDHSLTLKDMILRTGQHKALFDPRIWRGRLSEMQNLYDSLPEGLRNDIGPESFQELKEYDLAHQRRIALKAKKPSYPGPR